MSYAPKRTSDELRAICEHLVKKDECWVDALWELTEYLVNIEFSKRCLAVSFEKAWDATTEVFAQLKQRIDCKERINKNGTIIKPTPIENIVSYVYFALPKRFMKWCSTTMTIEERDKALVRIDTYDPETKCYSVNLQIEQQLAVERREFTISLEDTERLVLTWLGAAQNNIELKKRRQKLKAQGWEIVNGRLRQINLNFKEMARELAILESRPEELPAKEERRLKRIVYLKGELYGQGENN